MNAFPCLSAPPRPNITNRFQLEDELWPPLQNSSSSLNTAPWAELSNSYPGPIKIHLLIIICFRAHLGYEGPNAFILSKNLASALVDTEIIDKKLADDLRCCRVEKVTNSTLPFIFSPLGLVLKHDRGWKNIHHFSCPVGRSDNHYISDAAREMKYTQFQDILQMVIRAGRNCIILKRDIKDDFRNVSIAPYQQ